MSAILRERPRASEQSSTAAEIAAEKPSICFVGLGNLPVLAREYNHHAIGGEQVQQTLLAKAFASRGYRVSMVTADYGQPDGASWHGVTVYKAYALNAGLPIVRFIHPRWSGLWAAMSRANADVYYSSCSSAMVGQIAMFCRQHGKRFIFRVASDMDCAPEALMIKYWRDKKLYEYGLRRADGVLLQSMHQQRLLRHNYAVDGSLAGMLVESSSARTAFSKRDLTVLWVNNLRALKRPELFLEMADALPQLAFHVVGGAVPGQEADYERAKACALGRRNVTFHGHVPYHDVNPLYGRARIYVSTSDREGFPNSYLQAWRAGTPVVAYFDPDGVIAREGLGIAVRNQQELREAIHTLTTEEAAWTAASLRCRAFMDREFGDEAVLAPYRKLVDASAPPAHGLRPLRVVMAGPSLSVKGGVSSVERLILSHLPPDVRAGHIATMVDGGNARKLWTFARALMRYSADLTRRPDVVHIHFASRASSVRKEALARMALRRGFKVIMHSHGAEYRMYWDEMSERKRARTLAVLRQVSALIVLGEVWRDFFTAIGVPAQKIVVMPNPVRLPETVPMRTPSKTVTCVYFGIITRRKGAFDLVESVALLPPQYRERLRVIIAGNGRGAELRELVMQRGVGACVQVLDWVTPEQRDAMLASADIFALPSHHEGLPMALLEAMAFGLAPISTPVGSIGEIVESGVNGLLVPAGDTAAFSQALQRLIDDPEERATFGARARAAVEPLGIDVYIERLCRLYRTVARGKAPGDVA